MFVSYGLSLAELCSKAALFILFVVVTLKRKERKENDSLSQTLKVLTVGLVVVQTSLHHFACREQLAGPCFT